MGVVDVTQLVFYGTAIFHSGFHEMFVTLNCGVKEGLEAQGLIM